MADYFRHPGQRGPVALLEHRPVEPLDDGVVVRRTRRDPVVDVSPIPASSGRTDRHRLNRGGDRQANAALYRVVLTRLRWDPLYDRLR